LIIFYIPVGAIVALGVALVVGKGEEVIDVQVLVNRKVVAAFTTAFLAFTTF